MMKASAIFLCAALAASQASQPNPVSIHVDLAQPVGSYKPITSWFGYDESNYTTMKYGRELLGELHDLSPAPVHIRVHNLLTSGNGVPELKWSSSNVFTLDANGKPVYDFTITDETFDAFQKAGVRPMVELGFMPKDLAVAVPGVTEYQLHYPRPTMGGASNNPPKDYKLWGELVRKFTQHLVDRYGRQQVSTWYFEVWNEPDIIYWHGTPEEYFKLYDYAAAGVRTALPSAKVGGPASTGPSGAKSSAFLESFLEHCSRDKSAADGKPIPLDFISFHPKGRTVLVDGHVRMGISNELEAAQNGFQIVAKYPQFRRLPIILSEADPEGCAACSIKDNPANAYRNGPLYASYTAAVMKSLFELQDEAKVNLIAMLSWSFEFENKNYFEGFRTLATNGIDKPILNVFRMAGLMAGDRVSTSSTGKVSVGDLVKTGARQTPDIDSFATRADHEAAVMVWNYHDDDLPAPASDVQITISGIPAGVNKVLLEHYRIDETHSNAYTAWKNMGSPQSPTPDQYAQLKAAGQLQLLSSPAWIDVDNGRITIATGLPRQAVSLLRLNW
jgi:xylan 1,4-beta-xylosidase